MRQGTNIPKVALNASLKDALLEMSRKGLGMTAIVDANKAVGVFTDGDLRRAFESGINIDNTKISDIMHRNPQYIQANELAVKAVEIMEERKINALLVVDQQGELVGALNMHDLLIAKVV